MMVDEKELKEIKRLPPKERLKRLKDLETKRKKQEAEAKRIIEESLKEIKLDEMLKEIEVPKQEKVDVNKLFEKSKDIEEEISAEEIKKIEEGGTDYGRRIQELLPQDRMEQIQQWYTEGTAPPTREEFLEAYEHAREAYDVLQQSMQTTPNQELYSTPSEELTENVVGSMKIMRALGYKKRWFQPGG